MSITIKMAGVREEFGGRKVNINNINIYNWLHLEEMKNTNFLYFPCLTSAFRNILCQKKKKTITFRTL
jgi:hypothetical protein